jgi:hypothetical protein
MFGPSTRDFRLIIYNYSGDYLFNSSYNTGAGAVQEYPTSIGLLSNEQVVLGGYSSGGLLLKYFGFEFFNYTTGNLTNISSIHSSLTSNGDVWKCEAKVYDDLGSSDFYDSSVSIQGLTAAPIITIYSPEDNQNYTNATILVNISSDGDYTWFSNSSGDNETYSSEVERDWNEGLNTLIAYSNKSSGVENSTSVTFRVDTLSPNITIYSPENISYNNETRIVNFSVFDNGVGVDSVWYTNASGDNVTFYSALNWYNFNECNWYHQGEETAYSEEFENRSLVESESPIDIPGYSAPKSAYHGPQFPPKKKPDDASSDQIACEIRRRDVVESETVNWSVAIMNF